LKFIVYRHLRDAYHIICRRELSTHAQIEIGPGVELFLITAKIKTKKNEKSGEGK
jgi:hypothetical protein